MPLPLLDFRKANRLPEPIWIPVVAAAIRRGDGRLLLQQCPPGKRHAGLWEFPGGKVEPGELPEEGLAREIEEELGLKLDLQALWPAGFASEQEGEQGRPAVVLLLFSCREWRGEPEAREGQEFGWFGFAEASALPMPQLDRELIRRLSE